MNRMEMINVDLKTTFSKPRRVKELELPPPPKLRPNPVPRDWTRIAAVRSTDRTICRMNKNVFI